MKHLAIILWTLQAMAAVAMFVVSIVEIKSVIGTGPALSAFGLTLATVTRRLKSWEPLAFGLSGPLICAVVAALIAIFDLGPQEAAVPIPVLLGLYLLAAVPLAVLAERAIRRWQLLLLPGEQRVWQFSLKSLMIWMTVVCVGAAVGRWIVQSLVEVSGPVGENVAFVAFAAGAVILSAAVFWRFLASRRKSK